MSRPPPTDNFGRDMSPLRTPMSATSSTPISYAANVNRSKTKKWTQAKVVDYGGDDWGEDEYDEYDAEPIPPSPPKVTGLRQAGQAATAALSSQNVKKPYGDLPALPKEAQRSTTNPLLQRTNSFGRDDERRAFSNVSAAPPPVPAAQVGGVPQHVASAAPSSFTTDFPAPPHLSIQTRQPSFGQRKPVLMDPAAVDSPIPFSTTSSKYSQDSGIPESRPGTEPFPTVAVPLLQTRSSADRVPQTIPSRFPPRQSSMSGQDRPEIPDLTQRPGSSKTMEEQPSSPATTKALPFIRPSDIYKRHIEEQEERRRQSEDFARPSMDSQSRARSSHESNSPQRQYSGEQNDTEPSRELPFDSRARLQPVLEPVTERRSEYGFDNYNQSSLPPQPAVHEPATTQLLQTDKPDGNRHLSTSPKLPDLSRMSGFGMDMFFPSHAIEPKTEPAETPPIASDVPSSARDLRSEPSLGFTSAVHQAFDQAEIPHSASVRRTDSESTGTTGISPIMSRVPSAATAESRARVIEERDRATPVIIEAVEPISRPSSGIVGSADAVTADLPGSPSGFQQGHRRDLSAPSPDNNPARKPNLAIRSTAGSQSARISDASLASPLTDDDAAGPLASTKELAASDQEQSFRPSLPGGWVSYATTASVESTTSAGTIVPEHDGPTELPAPDYQVEDAMNLAPVAGNTGSPGSASTTTGPGMWTAGHPIPVISGGSGGTTSATSGVSQLPALHSQPSASSLGPPPPPRKDTPKFEPDDDATRAEPQKVAQEPTESNKLERLGTDREFLPSMRPRVDSDFSNRASPADENDQLRKEIMRSLSPTAERGSTISSLLMRADTDLSMTDATRESTYRPGGIYDDYWAESGDESPRPGTSRTHQSGPVGEPFPPSISVPADAQTSIEFPDYDNAAPSIAPLRTSKSQETRPPLDDHRFSWEATPTPQPVSTFQSLGEQNDGKEILQDSTQVVPISEHTSALDAHHEMTDNDIIEDRKSSVASSANSWDSTPVSEKSKILPPTLAQKAHVDEFESHALDPDRQQTEDFNDPGVTAGGLAVGGVAGLAAAAYAASYPGEIPLNAQHATTTPAFPVEMSMPVGTMHNTDAHRDLLSDTLVETPLPASPSPSTPATADEFKLDTSLSRGSGPNLTLKDPQQTPDRKVTQFRDILSMNTVDKRIKAYNETREIFATMDSGLLDWVTGLHMAHPELAGQMTPTPALVNPKLRGPKASATPLQQPYYQQYLNASSPTSTTPPPIVRPATRDGLSGTQSSGFGSSAGSKAGAKGKELIGAAKGFGGLGIKASKGLFAKGKSKIKGVGGDKIPSEPHSSAAATDVSSVTNSASRAEFAPQPNPRFSAPLDLLPSSRPPVSSTHVVPYKASRRASWSLGFARVTGRAESLGRGLGGGKATVGADVDVAGDTTRGGGLLASGVGLGRHRYSLPSTIVPVGGFGLGEFTQLGVGYLPDGEVEDRIAMERERSRRNLVGDELMNGFKPEDGSVVDRPRPVSSMTGGGGADSIRSVPRGSFGGSFGGNFGGSTGGRTRAASEVRTAHIARPGVGAERAASMGSHSVLHRPWPISSRDDKEEAPVNAWSSIFPVHGGIEALTNTGIISGTSHETGGDHAVRAGDLLGSPKVVTSFGVQDGAQTEVTAMDSGKNDTCGMQDISRPENFVEKFAVEAQDLKGTKVHETNSGTPPYHPKAVFPRGIEGILNAAPIETTSARDMLPSQRRQSTQDPYSSLPSRKISTSSGDAVEYRPPTPLPAVQQRRRSSSARSGSRNSRSSSHEASRAINDDGIILSQPRPISKIVPSWNGFEASPVSEEEMILQEEGFEERPGTGEWVSNGQRHSRNNSSGGVMFASPSADRFATRHSPDLEVFHDAIEEQKSNDSSGVPGNISKEQVGDEDWVVVDETGSPSSGEAEMASQTQDVSDNVNDSGLLPAAQNSVKARQSSFESVAPTRPLASSRENGAVGLGQNPSGIATDGKRRSNPVKDVGFSSDDEDYVSPIEPRSPVRWARSAGLSDLKTIQVLGYPSEGLARDRIRDVEPVSPLMSRGEQLESQMFAGPVRGAIDPNFGIKEEEEEEEGELVSPISPKVERHRNVRATQTLQTMALSVPVQDVGQSEAGLGNETARATEYAESTAVEHGFSNSTRAENGDSHQQGVTGLGRMASYQVPHHTEGSQGDSVNRLYEHSNAHRQTLTQATSSLSMVPKGKLAQFEGAENQTALDALNNTCPIDHSHYNDLVGPTTMAMPENTVDHEFEVIDTAPSHELNDNEDPKHTLGVASRTGHYGNHAASTRYAADSTSAEDDSVALNKTSMGQHNYIRLATELDDVRSPIENPSDTNTSGPFVETDKIGSMRPATPVKWTHSEFPDPGVVHGDVHGADRGNISCHTVAVDPTGSSETSLHDKPSTSETSSDAALASKTMNLPPRPPGMHTRNPSSPVEPKTPADWEPKRSNKPGRFYEEDDKAFEAGDIGASNAAATAASRPAMLQQLAEPEVSEVELPPEYRTQESSYGPTATRGHPRTAAEFHARALQCQKGAAHGSILPATGEAEYDEKQYEAGGDTSYMQPPSQPSAGESQRAVAEETVLPHQALNVRPRKSSPSFKHYYGEERGYDSASSRYIDPISKAPLLPPSQERMSVLERPGSNHSGDRTVSRKSSRIIGRRDEEQQRHELSGPSGTSPVLTGINGQDGVFVGLPPIRSSSTFAMDRTREVSGNVDQELRSPKDEPLPSRGSSFGVKYQQAAANASLTSLNMKDKEHSDVKHEAALEVGVGNNDGISHDGHGNDLSSRRPLLPAFSLEGGHVAVQGGDFESRRIRDSRTGTDRVDSMDAENGHDSDLASHLNSQPHRRHPSADSYRVRPTSVSSIQTTPAQMHAPMSLHRQHGALTDQTMDRARAISGDEKDDYPEMQNGAHLNKRNTMLQGVYKPAQSNFDVPEPPSSAQRYPELFRQEVRDPRLVFDDKKQKVEHGDVEPPANYYPQSVSREETFMPRPLATEYVLPDVGPPDLHHDKRSNSRGGDRRRIRSPDSFEDRHGKVSTAAGGQTSSSARSGNDLNSQSVTRESDHRGIEKTPTPTAEDLTNRSRRRSNFFGSQNRNSVHSQVSSMTPPASNTTKTPPISLDNSFSSRLRSRTNSFSRSTQELAPARSESRERRGWFRPRESSRTREENTRSLESPASLRPSEIKAVHVSSSDLAVPVEAKKRRFSGFSALFGGRSNQGKDVAYSQTEAGQRQAIDDDIMIDDRHRTPVASVEQSGSHATGTAASPQSNREGPGQNVHQPVSKASPIQRLSPSHTTVSSPISEAVSRNSRPWSATTRSSERTATATFTQPTSFSAMPTFPVAPRIDTPPILKQRASGKGGSPEEWFNSPPGEAAAAPPVAPTHNPSHGDNLTVKPVVHAVHDSQDQQLKRPVQDRQISDRSLMGVDAETPPMNITPVNSRVQVPFSPNQSRADHQRILSGPVVTDGVDEGLFHSAQVRRPVQDQSHTTHQGVQAQQPYDSMNTRASQQAAYQGEISNANQHFRDVYSTNHSHDYQREVGNGNVQRTLSHDQQYYHIHSQQPISQAVRSQDANGNGDSHGRRLLSSGQVAQNNMQQRPLQAHGPSTNSRHTPQASSQQSRVKGVGFVDQSTHSRSQANRQNEVVLHTTDSASSPSLINHGMTPTVPLQSPSSMSGALPERAKTSHSHSNSKLLKPQPNKEKRRSSAAGLLGGLFSRNKTQHESRNRKSISASTSSPQLTNDRRQTINLNPAYGASAQGLDTAASSGQSNQNGAVSYQHVEPQRNQGQIPYESYDHDDRHGPRSDLDLPSQGQRQDLRNRGQNDNSSLLFNDGSASQIVQQTITVPRHARPLSHEDLLARSPARRQFDQQTPYQLRLPEETDTPVARIVRPGRSDSLEREQVNAMAIRGNAQQAYIQSHPEPLVGDNHDNGRGLQSASYDYAAPVVDDRRGYMENQMHLRHPSADASRRPMQHNNGTEVVDGLNTAATKQSNVPNCPQSTGPYNESFRPVHYRLEDLTILPRSHAAEISSRDRIPINSTAYDAEQRHHGEQSGIPDGRQYSHAGSSVPVHGPENMKQQDQMVAPPERDPRRLSAHYSHHVSPTRSDFPQPLRFLPARAQEQAHEQGYEEDIYNATPPRSQHRELQHSANESGLARDDSTTLPQDQQRHSVEQYKHSRNQHLSANQAAFDRNQQTRAYTSAQQVGYHDGAQHDQRHDNASDFVSGTAQGDTVGSRSDVGETQARNHTDEKIWAGNAWTQGDAGSMYHEMDADPAPVMSATSYPGMEWNPYGEWNGEGDGEE